jgi:hypothetical protein
MILRKTNNEQTHPKQAHHHRHHEEIRKIHVFKLLRWMHQQPYSGRSLYAAWCEHKTMLTGWMTAPIKSNAHKAMTKPTLKRLIMPGGDS